MNDNQSYGRGWFRAISIGLVVSVITAVIMILMTKLGFSPFPKPPSLAFAERLTGQVLPLPVGMLFHTFYVTFWSAVFIRFFPNRNLKTAFLLAAALWGVLLVLFFPVIGWGGAGLDVSQKLMVASFMPHFLFGLLLWLMDAYVFAKK